MLNNCFKADLLPPSQRHNIITLACKDLANAQLLTNWRPISLLNVDYKMLAKVLAKWLRSVLSHCVHTDQTCAIPRRPIQDNLHLIRNIVDYSNTHNI